MRPLTSCFFVAVAGSAPIARSAARLFVAPLVLAFAAALATSPREARAQTALDMTLAPPEASTKEITDVFRDIVVVQRKAKEKARKLLFYSYASFDFSDGPTTMYGLNLNFGYALSDYWEVYVNYVPAFIAQERDIVGRVRTLTLIDGDQAAISYSRPQSQYGVELLWAPAYGKDSWGPYSIVRSDTYLKLSAGIVQYQAGTGNRFGGTLGKTFFLSRLFNLRMSAGAAYVEEIIDKKKQGYGVGLIETGLIWYL